MASLHKISQGSDLMNIDITYKGKRYRFNLHEELQIKETRLNDKLKEHASSYAFLTQFLTHLETYVEELERKYKKTYDKLYIKAKNKTTGGRPMSDDLCKATAGSSSIYQGALKKYIKAKQDKNIIVRAVRAYETRKDLMQTLSANFRQER